MPRNSSGIYSLPAGNPVVPNTLIETTWANPTMSDIGVALSDSLDRYGRGGMLAQLKLADGTAAQPAFAFNSESSTGLLRPGAGIVSVAVLGGIVASFAAAGVTFAQPPIYAADPVSANQLTRKSYVDAAIAAAVATGPYLPLIGGALAGPGNLTVGGTLGVTGLSTLATLAVTASATIGTTFAVTGNSTLIGSVGVGAAPGTAKLDVNGSIRAYGGNFFQSSVSGVNIGTSAGAAHMVLTTSAAPLNSKIYDILGEASGALNFRLLNDAGSSAGAWMIVTRSGITPGTIQMFAPIGFGAAPGLGATIDMFQGGGGGLLAGVNNIGGTSDSGAYTIWAGRNVLNGAYIQIFGGSHATNANQLLLGTASATRVAITAAGTVDISAGSGFLRIGNAITRFESAPAAPPTATSLATIAHGGPRVPDLIQLYLRCTTAELGYSVGDEMLYPFCDIGDPNRQMVLTGNATSIFFAMNLVGGATGMALRQNRGTGAFTQITAANWRVVVRAHWL